MGRMASKMQTVGETMIYYIRYKLITGLGQPEFCESFGTISERYECYRRILGAGYKLIEFGQRSK